MSGKIHVYVLKLFEAIRLWGDGSVSKFQYYSTKQLVKFFIEQGKEGECWDFKQEWHSEMPSLIKDIICFANTVHDENCYIIFGVSDDMQITGMKEVQRKQADIIDAISNLHFAGDSYPKISFETISFGQFCLDVLIIHNTDKTPIYLKKQYGKMREGCVYLRIEDKNTPDNGNADISDIENLWRKRLGLTKPPLDYIYDRLHNKLEWEESESTFYNIYKPEYTVEIVSEDDDRDADEFYSYAMTNERTSFQTLNIKYQQTILDSYEIAVLDSGRLQIPTPEWGFICHDHHRTNSKYSYKYYILGSKRYRVLSFLYNEENSDQRYAFDDLKDVVLFYQSEEERLAFEVYLEEHQEMVINRVDAIDRYNYIQADNESKTALYKQRLHTGIALNQLFKEWQEMRLQ